MCLREAEQLVSSLKKKIHTVTFLMGGGGGNIKIFFLWVILTTNKDCPCVLGKSGLSNLPSKNELGEQ